MAKCAASVPKKIGKISLRRSAYAIIGVKRRYLGADIANSPLLFASGDDGYLATNRGPVPMLKPDQSDVGMWMFEEDGHLLKGILGTHYLNSGLLRRARMAGCGRHRA